jgi:short-subunit dehydrogenase
LSFASSLIESQMSKSALITGSSNGIGYELAKIHAEKGDNLVLVARSKCKLDVLKGKLQDKHGIQVYTIEKDLSSAGAANEVFEELNGQDLIIDYLVNNAGFGDIGLFAASDWNKQERMITLNITALTHLTRLFLPGMIDRGFGKILNVASTASFQPGPTMSVYFATKAYVLSFSEAVNNEVRKTGVTVTALCPGSTETGFHAAALGEEGHLRERKLPSAREVAEYGYKAMMKGKAVAIPGFKNSVMATSVRFIPRSLVVNAARRIQENKH